MRGCGDALGAGGEGAEVGEPAEGVAELFGFGGGLGLDVGVEGEVAVEDVADVVAGLLVGEESVGLGGEVEAGLEVLVRESGAEVVVGEEEALFGALVL